MSGTCRKHPFCSDALQIAGKAAANVGDNLVRDAIEVVGLRPHVADVVDVINDHERLSRVTAISVEKKSRRQTSLIFFTIVVRGRSPKASCSSRVIIA